MGVCMAWQNTLKCIHFICGHLETYLSERLVAWPAEFELSRGCLLPVASFLADFLSRFLGAAWARPSARPGRLLHKHCPDPWILLCPCLPFLCFILTCRKFEQRRQEARKRRKIHLRNYFELTFAAPKRMRAERALFLIELLKNCLFAYWKSVRLRVQDLPLVELQPVR